MRIGFVGLGNMGRAMAGRLIEAGHEVVVYNRTRATAEEFVQKAGGAIADHPAGAAAQAEIVITMLADDTALESVASGTDGIMAAMPPGSIHISMSTISPALSQRLSAAHKEYGTGYVAAPVLGRPDAAAAGKLFIIAAGQPETLERVKPLFDIFGQRTFPIGRQPEQANLVKLVANFLITCVIESLGEVFAVSRKYGVDPKVVFTVLSSTLFNAPVYTGYGPRMLDQQFSPAGFTMPLGLKDVRLMLQAAEQATAPMPFAGVIRDRFLSGIAKGYGELDWSAIALVIAESAGLQAEEATTPQAAD